MDIKCNKSIFRVILAVCLPALLFSSCIRDSIPDCPPLTVKLKVLDKNYSNISSIQPLGIDSARSENLAFREYIPTLFYSLSDADSGELLEEQGIFKVEGNDGMFTLPICGTCLPHGRYVLTVWGGLNNIEQLSDDKSLLDLHPGHESGDDIYLAHDTLVYDYRNSSYVLDMERTKGKLIVVTENIPDTVASVYHKAEKVFEKVYDNFIYEGCSYADKNVSLNNKGKNFIVSGILAPSYNSHNSCFVSRLYDSDGNELKDINPEQAEFPMERNKIAAVKYVYKDDGSCTVMVFINDTWKVVHDMDIED